MKFVGHRFGFGSLPLKADTGGDGKPTAKAKGWDRIATLDRDLNVKGKIQDFILTKEDFMEPKSRKMVVIAILMFLIMVGSFSYYLRDARFVSEFTHNDKDIIVEIDGATVPVSVFLDSSPTMFYAYDYRDRGLVPMRLIIAISDKNSWMPGNLIVLSCKGIGVVGCNPIHGEMFGVKFLLFKPIMNVSYDVRDDMKGLGASVERRILNSCVEYRISGCQFGNGPYTMRIMLKEFIYDFIGASMRSDTVEAP